MTEAELNNVKLVRITVVGNDDIQETIELSPEKLIEMTNSVLFQTLTHAIGTPASHLIDVTSARALPNIAFFDDVKDGTLSEMDVIGMSHKEYSKLMVVGDKEYCFDGSKRDFENNKTYALNYIRTKQRIEYLKKNPKW